MKTCQIKGKNNTDIQNSDDNNGEEKSSDEKSNISEDLSDKDNSNTDVQNSVDNNGEEKKSNEKSNISRDLSDKDKNNTDIQNSDDNNGEEKSSDEKFNISEDLSDKDKNNTDVQNSVDNNGEEKKSNEKSNISEDLSDKNKRNASTMKDPSKSVKTKKKDELTIKQNENSKSSLIYILAAIALLTFSFIIIYNGKDDPSIETESVINSQEKTEEAIDTTKSPLISKNQTKVDISHTAKVNNQLIENYVLEYEFGSFDKVHIRNIINELDSIINNSAPEHSGQLTDLKGDFYAKLSGYYATKISSGFNTQGLYINIQLNKIIRNRDYFKKDLNINIKNPSILEIGSNKQGLVYWTNKDCIIDGSKGKKNKNN